MNENNKHHSGSQTPHLYPLRLLQSLCGQCYHAVLRRLGEVKASVLREFSWTMNGQEQVLRAAVNEAEALAWQTPFPHLLFPGLAQEKALAAQQWAQSQRAVRAGFPMSRAVG